MAWFAAKSVVLKRLPCTQGNSYFEKSGEQMRILVFVVILLTVAEVADTVWFDGRYGQAIWRYINHEARQAKNQVTSIAGSVVIRAPNLSRFWKIP